MSRPRWRLRDAALGYASQGIPVLPLHYALPDHGGLQPVPSNQQPELGTGCSCRDPGCGQVAKHPLGSLVPHGVKDATCNRARVLAWWTRHPQANIGLATGHRFDVLDVDGTEGAQAIRTLAAEHGLQSSGPWNLGTSARLAWRRGTALSTSEAKGTDNRPAGCPKRLHHISRSSDLGRA